MFEFFYFPSPRVFFLLFFIFLLVVGASANRCQEPVDSSGSKRDVIRRIVENNWRNVVSAKEIEDGKMFSSSLPDSTGYSLRFDVTAYRRKEPLLFRGAC